MLRIYTINLKTVSVNLQYSSAHCFSSTSTFSYQIDENRIWNKFIRPVTAGNSKPAPVTSGLRDGPPLPFLGQSAPGGAFASEKQEWKPVAQSVNLRPRTETLSESVAR